MNRHYDECKYTHTEFVVCPYCLYENQDCWEYNKGEEGGFDAWCDSCGKEFRCERVLNIHFNSTPTEDLDEEEDDWDDGEEEEDSD